MGIFNFFRRTPTPPQNVLALPSGAAGDGQLMLTRGGDVPENRTGGPSAAGPPEHDYKDLPLLALAHWAVPQIRGALDQHQMGMFQQSALLIESTLGDGRVQTALNGRLKGITMRHPHVDAAPGDTGGKYAELCKRLWGDILHDELMDQVWTWAVMSGWNLCEIRWELRRVGGLPGWAPEYLWFPVLVPWHQFYTWYHIVDRTYMAVTEDGVIPIQHGDPKWWLMTPWGEYRGWLRGAVRSVAPNWAVRQYALRDWARFSETHGLPLKMLKPPAQASASDKQRMMNQVATMGTATTIMLPQQTGPDGASWLLELLEAKDRAWEAFPGLLDHCDREIQQVIRGTNLTSEVQGGSYAAAQVHADEDSGYADSDARKLCASVSHVFRLFLRFNFGDEAEALCPRFRLEAPDKADVLALAQSQQFAMMVVKQAREEGIKLDLKKYCERFAIPFAGLTEPEPDDDNETQADPTPVAP